MEFLDRPMSQDPHDHLLLQIRGAVAEYERVLIAERMRRGRQMKPKAGALLPWTVPPYGYRSAPDRPRDPAAVQIEPAEGAVVRELFARDLEDKGTLLGLAKYLWHLGDGRQRIAPPLASWQSALECGFHPRITDQSGLYRTPVYWSKSLAAGAHPAVSHSSAGQFADRLSNHVAITVTPRKCPINRGMVEARRVANQLQHSWESLNGGPSRPDDCISARCYPAVAT